MRRSFYLALGFLLTFSNHSNAQRSVINEFQRVRVPDSISLKLENTYKQITGFDSVNVSNNVWNLINSKDLIFKDGLYSFKGQGPHFPRRLFIFDKGKIYIFSSNYIDKVLEEYLECIQFLHLSEINRIKYLNKISVFLQQEFGETYGEDLSKKKKG